MNLELLMTAKAHTQLSPNQYFKVLAIYSLLLSAISFSVNVSAAQLHGVEFSETSRIVNTEKNVSIDLQLNGVGTRSYGLLRTKIYVAALYLESPSSVDIDILRSEKSKQIKMQYLRSIDQDDMREAWVYYFEENCPERDCSAHQQSIDQFMNSVIDAKPDDEYDYRFFSDSVEILINDESLARINNAAFSRLLLSTWIGDKPPTKRLKRNLLNAK